MANSDVIALKRGYLPNVIGEKIVRGVMAVAQYKKINSALPTTAQLQTQVTNALTLITEREDLEFLAVKAALWEQASGSSAATLLANAGYLQGLDNTTLRKLNLYLEGLTISALT